MIHPLEINGIPYIIHININICTSEINIRMVDEGFKEEIFNQCGTCLSELVNDLFAQVGRGFPCSQINHSKIATLKWAEISLRKHCYLGSS